MRRRRLRRYIRRLDFSNQRFVRGSIITEGCDIRGSVSNSVLSSSVTVGEGARIDYSILMPGCTVGPGAVVQYAIIGEGATIGANAAVGAPPNGKTNILITTCGPGSAVANGGVIPAGTYQGQDADVPTAAVINFLVTHEDVSDETAYQMTKLIFDNLDKLKAAHSAAAGITLENAPKDSPVPLHPGAERF